MDISISIDIYINAIPIIVLLLFPESPLDLNGSYKVMPQHVAGDRPTVLRHRSAPYPPTGDILDPFC